MPTVAIVGASLGALRAAENLRRTGFSGTIRIFGEEKHLPYNRPPLSKEFLRSDAGPEALSFPLRAIISDVEWQLGSRVEQVDLNEKYLRTEDGSRFEFDDLVIATGLRSRRLAVAGAGLAGCFALRTLDDAAQLRPLMRSGAKVVIIGSGFIGCELAATARALGCEVTVVGRERLPLAGVLGPDLAAELLRRHENHGVVFELGRQVTRLIGVRKVSGVVLDDGRELPADVVLEAIGSQPNHEWLAGADLLLAGGVETDGGMRALKSCGTPWPNVFVVGDIAKFPNPRFHDEARAVEHWNIPTETAKRAAAVLAARHGEANVEEVLARPFGPVPSFWSDQYDSHVLAYGVLDGADEIVMLDGTAEDSPIYGYYRNGTLMGVCGLDNRAEINRYRGLVGESADAAQRREKAA